MRLLFIFLNTLILSCAIVLLLTYVSVRKPWPADAHGVDERSLAYVFSLGINLILVMGSTTMFLNFIKKIRNDSWYSFASFFLVPILSMLYVMSKFNSSGILVYYAVVFIPFFVILAVNFIFFRNQVFKKLYSSLKEENYKANICEAQPDC